MFGVNKPGQAITDGLRAFNVWRDDFLIELSTLALMAGFIIGTVDVLSRDGLSSIPAFSNAWAIIQAVAIDGLFFAIWGRVRRATWQRATCFQNTMLVLVGLLLAGVAVLVNGLLSYQELVGGVDIGQAMNSFGVDQVSFSYARAMLVVLVAVLVALFARGDGSQKIHTDRQELTAVLDQEHLAKDKADLQAIIDALREANSALQEEIQPYRDSRQKTIAGREPRAKPEAKAETARDRIKLAMRQAIVDGQRIKYPAIADRAGAGYSTVKLYAQDIRAELASEGLTERTTDELQAVNG